MLIDFVDVHDVELGTTEDLTAARAFELVWTTLVGVLGTAATATIFRRAARNAFRRRPDLRELVGFDVVREGMDYRFTLPASWSARCDDCFRALRYLVREQLFPLLEELTGAVVIRLVGRLPDLQRCGLVEAPGERDG